MEDFQSEYEGDVKVRAIISIQSVRRELENMKMQEMK